MKFFKEFWESFFNTNCPHCDKKIRRNAMRCRWCGRWLRHSEEKEDNSKIKNLIPIFALLIFYGCTSDPADKFIDNLEITVLGWEVKTDFGALEVHDARIFNEQYLGISVKADELQKKKDISTEQIKRLSSLTARLRTVAEKIAKIHPPEPELSY